MSEKTVFTKSSVENVGRLISPPPERIVWCYGEFQSIYQEMTDCKIEFVEGFPEELYASSLISAEHDAVVTQQYIIFEEVVVQCAQCGSQY